MRGREPYEYDVVPEAGIVRELDPTEHNMERLNRNGRGAGIVYQTARVRGPLRRAAVEAAVEALTRHAALRMRVVRRPDGALCFAEVENGRPEVEWVEVDDPEREWPPYVEADMNAGSVPSHRGSGFRVFVLTAREEHAIVIAAPHHLWDALSSIALMNELLETIAQPRALPPVALRAVESSFVAPSSAEHEAMLGRLAQEVAAYARLEPDERYEHRDRLHASLEEIEDALLAGGDDDVWAAALLVVQRLRAQVQRWRPDNQNVVAEEDAGPPPERTERVRSGFFVDVLAPDVITRSAVAARQRGITMHGVFGAAMLFAHAARHWELIGIPDGSQAFPIASAVSLRRQFQPPLADDDVRMAVDMIITITSVHPADGFWDVAARFGGGVTREVQRRRALGSWFRAERHPMELPLPGLPIPLVSNVGRVSAATHRGDLELCALHGMMATHNVFPIAMLVQTFRDAAHIAYYHELPTVSGSSMRRVLATVRGILERLAIGETPIVSENVR